MSSLACECWERGSELPSLSLRKLFTKPNEAYHDWNAALPGYVKPSNKLGAPFSSTKDLEKNFLCAQEIRKKLLCEMVARQEEMDWLVYVAYGLIAETDSAVGPLTEDVDLATEPGADTRMRGLALKGVVQDRPELGAVLPDVILEASHGDFPYDEAGLTGPCFDP